MDPSEEEDQVCNILPLKSEIEFQKKFGAELDAILKEKQATNISGYQTF